MKSGRICGSSIPVFNVVGVAAAAAVQGGANTVVPAVYALELISPRVSSATGGPPSTGGTGLHSTHRAYYAYPGLEYNIRAVVRGGSYPYTFSLSNAPSGMTVDTRTGEISWPDPQSTATNITLNVTDSEDNTTSGTWSVTVGTSGWVFVDANAGTNGSGTLASPFNSLQGLLDGAGADTRTYFRAGTYTAIRNGSDLGGNHFASMNFRSTVTSVVWAAYPGETPVIDQALSEDGEVCIEFGQSSGYPPYVDGLTFTNALCKAVLIGAYVKYPFHFIRCTFTTGGGHDGHNSGFISVRNYATDPNPRCGSSIQDCTFDDMSGETCIVKLYGCDRLVFEDNVITDTTDNAEGSVAMKNAVPLITVRNNTGIVGLGQPLVGGNMNYDPSVESNKCGGEICYNNIAGGGTVDALTNIALRWQNKINDRGDFAIYRNTVNGMIEHEGFNSSDGVLSFYNNVIVNGYGSESPNPYIYDYALTDNTRIETADNLTSATTTDVIDASGLLTGTSRTTYLGSRGHEIP
jgi:hypothetical protein